MLPLFCGDFDGPQYHHRLNTGFCAGESGLNGPLKNRFRYSIALLKLLLGWQTVLKFYRNQKVNPQVQVSYIEEEESLSNLRGSVALARDGVVLLTAQEGHFSGCPNFDGDFTIRSFLLNPA